jgi:hypothetical protein
VGKINNNFECKRNPQKIVYLISDFQQSTADLKKVVFQHGCSILYCSRLLQPLFLIYTLIRAGFHHLTFITGQMVSIVCSGKKIPEIKIIVRQIYQAESERLKKVVASPFREMKSKHLKFLYMVNQKGWIKGKLELDDYPVSLMTNISSAIM